MPTAMITGASRGLGMAIAEALAPTHTLFLAGRPTAELDAVAERLGATTWPMDLTDHEGVEATVEPIVELDVLVHNAGVAYPGRVGESSIEEWRATMEVNVLGAVGLTLPLLPALRAARGQVIFVNSGAGRSPSPGLASYTASKFALRGFADALRADEPALRVTTVYPGRIDTDMQWNLVAYEGGDYDPARFLKPSTVAQLIAQIVATPDDAHQHEVIIRPR